MGRLIDADKLLKLIEDFGEGQGRLDLIDPYYIRNAPTVEAIPKTEMRKMLRDCADKVSDNILDIVRKEYIPKDQYEARLKADMVAMLEELKAEIEELKNEPACCQHYKRGVNRSSDIIQQKINSLMEDQEGGRK